MKLLITVVFSVLSFRVHAQLNSSFVYLNKDFRLVNSVDSARYFIRTFQANDSCWQRDTYNVWGPMISSQQSKDADAKEAHGIFIYYRKNGLIDSTGKVVNGQLNGDWNFFNDTGKLYLQKKYENGKLLRVRDIIQEEKDTLKKPTDTVKVEFKRAEFRDGLAGWRHYLTKSLKFPERAKRANKEGTVLVQFLVNKDGGTEEVHLFRSIEYSLDSEAMRMIRQSPSWTPATKNGEPVKSYMRQPIVFRLD